MAEQKAPTKVCLIASKGSLDMAYPPIDPGKRWANVRNRNPYFFHVLGSGHHHQEEKQRT